MFFSPFYLSYEPHFSFAPFLFFYFFQFIFISFSLSLSALPLSYKYFLFSSFLIGSFLSFFLTSLISVLFPRLSSPGTDWQSFFFVAPLISYTPFFRLPPPSQCTDFSFLSFLFPSFPFPSLFHFWFFSFLFFLNISQFFSPTRPSFSRSQRHSFFSSTILHFLLFHKHSLFSLSLFRLFPFFLSHLPSATFSSSLSSSPLSPSYNPFVLLSYQPVFSFSYSLDFTLFLLLRSSCFSFFICCSLFSFSFLYFPSSISSYIRLPAVFSFLQSPSLLSNLYFIFVIWGYESL